jgi:hypothetical protein
MSMGVASIIVLVDLEILQIYGSIISFATHKNILVLRVCLVTLYLLCCIIPLGKLIFGIWFELWEWEQFSGMFFLLLCLVYDNLHSAFLIYRLTKRNQDKRIHPTVLEKSLRSTVLWNAVIAGIDWVSLVVVFSAVLLTSGTTKIAIEQCASGLMGIHASMILILFQRLKDLTFVGQRPRVVQPVKPIDDTAIESKTQKMVNI